MKQQLDKLSTRRKTCVLLFSHILYLLKKVLTLTWQLTIFILVLVCSLENFHSPAKNRAELSEGNVPYMHKRAHQIWQLTTFNQRYKKEQP